jgi:hypothetical protein
MLQMDVNHSSSQPERCRKPNNFLGHEEVAHSLLWDRDGVVAFLYVFAAFLALPCSFAGLSPP